MNIRNFALALGILGSLGLPGCNLDIPDLNNPGLDQLENNPTVAGINTASTGLLVGFRGGKATTAGYVNQLGIVGREAYDFDTADTRFVSELIRGNLSKASPFGGAFWAGQYANIRLANIILRGVEKVADFTEPQKAGVKGFAHTIIALELFGVIVTHDETGAVIDTDIPLGEPLGPFVSKTAVYDEIGRLLDLGKTELAMAGMTFTFPLSAGYTGFNTPPNFLKFNRAIKARRDVYMKKYADALTALSESFISESAATPAAFDTGVFHAYSTNPGDATNGLINVNIYAHPGILADVQSNGATADLRYTAKITVMASTVTSGTDASLKTTIKFKRYPNNSAPVPVIRNEELILLKAEALWFTSMQQPAIDALNIVRTKSGGLAAITTLPANDTEFITALLHERRYSLMFEGGHRWIDLRRFGIQLPLDDAAHVRNVRYPIPQAECDARPGEKACTINSSDPVQ